MEESMDMKSSNVNITTDWLKEHFNLEVGTVVEKESIVKNIFELGTVLTEGNIHEIIVLFTKISYFILDISNLYEKPFPRYVEMPLTWGSTNKSGNDIKNVMDIMHNRMYYKKNARLDVCIFYSIVEHKWNKGRHGKFALSTVKDIKIKPNNSTLKCRVCTWYLVLLYFYQFYSGKIIDYSEIDVKTIENSIEITVSKDIKVLVDAEVKRLTKYLKKYFVKDTTFKIIIKGKQNDNE